MHIIGNDNRETIINMGEADRFREYSLKRPRSPFVVENNEIITIMVLNIVMFVIMISIRLMYAFNPEISQQFFSEILPYFQISSDYNYFFTHPWTILTHMFTETGEHVVRLLVNMMWLWAYGYIFKETAGFGKMIGVYLYGGVAGGMGYVLGYTFFPEMNGNAVVGMFGANTGLLAIIAAATWLNPQFRMFPMIRGGIPLWVLTVIYLIMDLGFGVGAINKAYLSAHGMALLIGVVFALFYQRGTDITDWMFRFYQKISGLFQPKNNQSKIKSRFFYEVGDRAPYQKQSFVSQQRVDEILDKINAYGYDKLTQEEKDILKRYADNG